MYVCPNKLGVLSPHESGLCIQDVVAWGKMNEFEGWQYIFEVSAYFCAVLKIVSYFRHWFNKVQTSRGRQHESYIYAIKRLQ